MNHRVIERSVSLYTVLLRIYPASFRLRHQQAQVQMFRDVCVRHFQRGWLPFAFFWARTIMDLFWNGSAERFRAVKDAGRRERSMRSAVLFHDVGRDLSYAVRSARRRPGVITASVITLALGTGAALSVFTVVNSVVFQPLQLSDSDDLVAIQRIRPNGLIGQLSYPDILTIRDESDVFQLVAGYSLSDRDIGGIDQPVRTEVATVTGEFFDVVRWLPQMGRVLNAGDDRSEERIVVITHEMWQRRFGGDTRTIGRSLSINDQPHEIVGVLAPRTTPFPSVAVEAFLPPRENFNLGAFWLHGLGRLAPGYSLEDSKVQLDALAANIARAHPDIYEGREFAAQSLLDSVIQPVRPLLLILLAAVTMVLAVASANVANLMLVRTRSRQREFAVRTAIGAGRPRLVRQLLVESVLLSLVGCGLGLVFSRWATAALLAVSPVSLPRQSEVEINGVVVLTGIGAALIVGVLLGLIATVSLPRSASAARPTGGDQSPSPRGMNLKAGLVIGQIAIAVVLVVGAGLLTKSFMILARVDPGFQPENLISFRVSLPRSHFEGRAEISAFHVEARRRIAAVPGVVQAASTSLNPFNGGNLCSEVSIETNLDAVIPCAEFRAVSPGYFAAVGASIELGRDVDEGDDENAPPVAVVNQALARLAWPDESALGKRLRIWDEFPNTMVVGVSTDVRQFGLDRPAVPAIYMPQRQFPFRYARYLVRTDGPPAGAVDLVERAVRDVNPNVPIAELAMMRELVANSISEPRFRMLLMSAVAILAFSVSVVGVASVVSFTVTQRIREIGVRMALGANRRAVVKEVVGSGMRLAALGGLIGLLIAIGLVRVLERFLFGVRPLDWSVLALSVAIVFLASLLAAYVPGRRASAIDPLVALRVD